MFTQQLKVILLLWHDDFYLLITITPDQEIWLYQADTDNNWNNRRVTLMTWKDMIVYIFFTTQ
jgi:hypothetical protein